MKELKRIIRGIDKTLLFTTMILIVIGLFNIINASSQLSVIKYKSSLYSYFYKQAAVVIAALFGSIFILKTPTKKYNFWGLVAYIGVLFLLILVYTSGENYNGNQNWILIGPFQIQPSEFSKPVMVITMSLLFEKFYRKLRTVNMDHYKLIVIILISSLIFPILVFFENDYGTCMILLLIFCVMFFSSPVIRIEKLYTFFFLVVCAILGSMVLIFNKGGLLSNSQSDRLNGFWKPCSRYETGGYQICNGFIAINSGGLFGVGIGESKQKSYIPESPTDSVFAIISEEVGLVPCSFIFIFYIIILYRILKLSSNPNNTIRGRYICLGIGTYFFLHIMINLGGLFGAMPLTGVPLPFLSAGGSYTITLILSMAVIQRISIEVRNKKIEI